MYLDSFLFAQFPELFSCGGYVGNNYGDVLLIVVWWIVVVVVGCGGSVRLVGVGEPVLPLVEGPCWKLAML